MASTVASAPTHPRLRRFFQADQRSGWTSVAVLAYGANLATDAPSPLWLAAAIGLMALTLLLLVRVVVQALRGPKVQRFWRRTPDGAATMMFVAGGFGLLARGGGPWPLVAAGVSFAFAVWGLVGVVARVVRWPVQVDER